LHPLANFVSSVDQVDGQAIMLVFVRSVPPLKVASQGLFKLAAQELGHRPWAKGLGVGDVQVNASASVPRVFLEHGQKDHGPQGAASKSGLLQEGTELLGK